MRLWSWLGMALAIALGIVLFAQVDLTDRDFSGFWLGSRFVLEGRDPYDAVPWIESLRAIAPRLAASVPTGAGYGYPLWTALLTIPFAVWEYDLASRLWLAAQTFLALAGLAVLVATLRPDARWEFPALMLMFAMSAPWAALADIGNVGGFLLAIVSGAMALLLRGHPFAAGALLGLLLLKPHLFLLFVPLLVLRYHASARPIVAGGIATAGVLVLASLLVEPTWIGQWSLTLSRVSAGLGPRATAWGLVAAGPSAALIVPAVGALVLWALRAAHEPRSFMAAALAASIFAAPYAGNYDQILLFASAAVAVTLLAAARPMRRLLGSTIIVTILVPLPWILGFALERGASESLAALAPLLLLLAVVASDRLYWTPTISRDTALLVILLGWSAVAVWLLVLGVPGRWTTGGVAGSLVMAAVAIAAATVLRWWLTTYPRPS